MSDHESDDDSYDSNEEDLESDGGFADYYVTDDEEIRTSQFNNNDDPEYFAYECLTVANVEKIFNESIETVRSSLGLSHARAKQLLHANKWNIQEILAKSSYRVASPPADTPASTPPSSETKPCLVCASDLPASQFTGLKGCGHSFCGQCWGYHCETQIKTGVSTTLSCMQSGCDNLVDEDLVLAHVTTPEVRERYIHLSFIDYVRCHPNLRFCPGPNCDIVVKAEDSVAKEVICVSCKSKFCFKCANSYHAPTDCETIRQWLNKCADDSETANYISAHTKDCPKCNICIEKNGGCNHMQCFNCKHDFCWMCLGNWRTHGSEYYECSR